MDFADHKISMVLREQHILFQNESKKDMSRIKSSYATHSDEIERDNEIRDDGTKFFVALTFVWKENGTF